MTSKLAVKDEFPNLLPARMLNEFVYCPRLFYIEYVQGQFEDSADTVEGHYKHQRVDRESGALPTAREGEEEGAKIHARSVILSSEKHRLIARMDIVEGEGSIISPVDYKKGARPDIPEGAWPADIVQICVQALVLQDNGYDCNNGVIYYSKSKERVNVPITEELIDRTLSSAKECRHIASSGVIPSPLEDSPKCPRCSLVGICLPDEVNALLSPVVDTKGVDKEIRRLYPARDDAIPVYVQEQGARVGKHGEELEIKKKGEVIAKARLMEVSQLSLFGNAQITTQALHELCKRNIPICYLSSGGWFYGITHGMSHKNVELRIRQYEFAGDPEKALLLARRFVEGKIRNCRTLLRRNCKEKSKTALSALAKWARSASGARSAEELLGIEGSAGRVYFLHFKDMLKQNTDIPFDFNLRNRRPPKDPVNAMLSYLYAVLAKETAVTLLSVGFDPYLGFYHRPRYGRPSLALDTMEEFRPLIGDSVVIGLINNGEITQDDFVHRGGAASLTSGGKKIVLRAYERRMDSLITHPVFGYTISYRRVLEVQARLLARYISNEVTEYPIFCTR